MSPQIIHTSPISDSTTVQRLHSGGKDDFRAGEHRAETLLCSDCTEEQDAATPLEINRKTNPAIYQKSYQYGLFYNNRVDTMAKTISVQPLHSSKFEKMSLK